MNAQLPGQPSRGLVGETGLTCSFGLQRDWKVHGPKIVKSFLESHQAVGWTQAAHRVLWGWGQRGRPPGVADQPGRSESCPSPRLGVSSPGIAEALRSQHAKENLNLAVWTGVLREVLKRGTLGEPYALPAACPSALPAHLSNAGDLAGVCPPEMLAVSATHLFSLLSHSQIGQGGSGAVPPQGSYLPSQGLGFLI